MAKSVMRIILKGYDHRLVDEAAAKIIDNCKRDNSCIISGPIPLPTKKEVVTILRAVHKYKDSREQFEQKTHKRLIDIVSQNNNITNTLRTLEIPAGVAVDIKMK